MARTHLMTRTERGAWTAEQCRRAGDLRRRTLAYAVWIPPIVAQVYNVPLAELLGSGRTAELAEARHVTMYAMRHWLYWPALHVAREDGATRASLRRVPLPYGRIAPLLGRDHSTVMHGVACIEHKMLGNPALRVMVADIFHALQVAYQRRRAGRWAA